MKQVFTLTQEQVLKIKELKDLSKDLYNKYKETNDNKYYEQYKDTELTVKRYIKIFDEYNRIMNK